MTLDKIMDSWDDPSRSPDTTQENTTGESPKTAKPDTEAKVKRKTAPAKTKTRGGKTGRRRSKGESKSTGSHRPAYLTGEEDPFDQTDEEFWGETAAEAEAKLIAGVEDLMAKSRGRKADGSSNKRRSNAVTTIKGDHDPNTDEDGRKIDPSMVASPEVLSSAASGVSSKTANEVSSRSEGDVGVHDGVDPANGDGESNGNGGVVLMAGSHDVVPEFDFKVELESTSRTSQVEALYYLLHGDNMILSGQAGAGKSWVIDTFRKIVDDLINPNLEAENGSTLEVAYTASTGVAATLIKGQTIHSWSGLGIDVDPFSLDTLPESRKWWMLNTIFDKIRKTDCLIIDEVSMLPAYYLENLDREFKIARNSDEPFGGMQVVLVGDFLQLPPVDTHQRDSNGNPVNGGYCFTARNDDGRQIFSCSGFKWCYLDKSRRSNDDKLTRLLNGIRNGDVTWEDLQNLRSRYGQEPDPSKTYTELKTVNRSVDAFNEARLNELPGRAHVYHWEMEGDAKKGEGLRKILNLHDVRLKPGAVVMLTSNQASADPMLVNGSMGEVVTCYDDGVLIRFNDGAEHLIPLLVEKVLEKNTMMTWDYDLGKFRPSVREQVVAKVTYLPVKLAWAVTVHKSQGQTLDGAVIDLSRCFTKGLGYVALSRCRSLDDIIMKGSWESLPQNALLVNGSASAADQKIKSKAGQLHGELMERQRRSHALLEMASLLIKAGDEDARTLEDRAMDEAPVDVALADDLSVYEFVRDHRLWKRAWGMNVRRSKGSMDDLIDRWVTSPVLVDASVDVSVLDSLRSYDAIRDRIQAAQSEQEDDEQSEVKSKSESEGGGSRPINLPFDPLVFLDEDEIDDDYQTEEEYEMHLPMVLVPRKSLSGGGAIGAVGVSSYSGHVSFTGKTSSASGSGSGETDDHNSGSHTDDGPGSDLPSAPDETGNPVSEDNVDASENGSDVDLKAQVRIRVEEVTKDLRSEIDRLKKRVQELEDENAKLRSQVDED